MELLYLLGFLILGAGIVGMILRESSDDVAVPATVSDKDFESLNGKYSNYDDFLKKTSDLREKFRRLGKQKQYFSVLDRYEDKVLIRFKVDEHFYPLKRNLELAVKKNDYGAVVQDKREEKIIEFLMSVSFRSKVMSSDDAISEVLDQVHELTLTKGASGFNPSSIPTDGFEFEYWVASNLSKFGWNAAPTKGSGDQGVDVIAEKKGVRVGIQCKLYSSNVGNKAVQEINAAKAFFRLDKVAVITNAGYTKSAQNLAIACGVELLSHYDIPRFDALFLRDK